MLNPKVQMENEQEEFETTGDNQEEEQTNDYEDNQESEEENITLDDYKALLERNKRAEKALVELKKAKKTEKKETVDNPKELYKSIIAEERFYDKNPEAIEYKDKIESYQSKGLSLEEAFVLATRLDKQVDEQRQVYGDGLLKGNQITSEGINTVSVDAFDSMTVEQQNQYTDKMKAKYGKIKFK